MVAPAALQAASPGVRPVSCISAHRRRARHRPRNCACPRGAEAGEDAAAEKPADELQHPAIIRAWFPRPAAPRRVQRARHLGEAPRRSTNIAAASLQAPLPDALNSALVSGQSAPAGEEAAELAHAMPAAAETSMASAVPSSAAGHHHDAHPTLSISPSDRAGGEVAT